MTLTDSAGGLVSDAELARLRAAVEARLPDYLVDLERLVDIDCGSYTKAGVDEVGRFTAAFLRGLGALVATEPGGELGDVVIGTLEGQPGGPRPLLIGHMDTVFDPGTAAARPFTITDGRATGPGVTDMKSGLLAGLYALAALRELTGESAEPATWLPFERLTFIANPDEEIGSPVSSPHIRAHAARSDLALVLECARENGDIVSSRKGVADLRLRISGRAAHAGVEPYKGRSAILEAAHKVVALHGLNGRWPGVTVNVGVVAGGTRANVVAEEATLDVDLRATGRASMEEGEAALRAICAATTVPDVHCEVEAVARHWPMEKLAASIRLVEHAQAIAGRLGFTANDAATGGASDANTTAGMGVPSLDGLGPVGGNDHSPREYLEVASIVPRTTLLAALLLALSRDPAVAGWRAAKD
jgi:glutamate carboxypeptidase